MSVDTGFSCNGGIGTLSTCTSVCGDGLKYGLEACDNGNQTGCTSNCRPDAGFTCLGGIGAKSDCQVRCGDGVLGGA